MAAIWVGLYRGFRQSGWLTPAGSRQPPEHSGRYLQLRMPLAGNQLIQALPEVGLRYWAADPHQPTTIGTNTIAGRRDGWSELSGTQVYPHLRLSDDPSRSLNHPMYRPVGARWI